MRIEGWAAAGHLGRTLLLFAVLTSAACSGGGDDVSGDDGDEVPVVVDPYDGHASPVYDGTEAWLCHPDLVDDDCRDLSSTLLGTDGLSGPGDLEVAPDSLIDCFYVYPTVTTDEGTNSDMQPDDAEHAVVRGQAAPFAATCRMFVPVYRQVPLATYLGAGREAASETAYADVLDAWQTYVSQHNDGRGVVLIGHSQGSALVKRLAHEEIDDQPVLRDRLVSAIIPGDALEVADPQGTGGEFENIPACEGAGQTGCVINWVSYRADSPPGPSSQLGRFDFGEESPERPNLCVSPAALAGGDGLADPIVPTGHTPLLRVDYGIEAATAFASLPGSLELRCAQSDGIDYLAVIPVAGDPRPLDGLTYETTGPISGLHSQDINLVLGDLLTIIQQQTASLGAD